MNQCNLTYLKSLTPLDFEAKYLACASRYFYINWLALHYKILTGGLYFVILLSLVIIPLCFFTIKMIAEDYLSISIEKLKTIFKISTVVASCTIIPFVNGIPDLMVAIVSSDDQEGLHIALGSLMGAFLFASCLITGLVVFFNVENFLSIPFKPFLKDLVFYFLGLVMIMIFGFIKDLNIYYALSLIFFYCVYIFITIYFFSKNENDLGEKKLQERAQKAEKENKIKLNIITKDYLKIGNEFDVEENAILEIKTDEGKVDSNSSCIQIKDIEYKKDKNEVIEKLDKELKKRFLFGTKLKIELWNSSDRFFTKLLKFPFKLAFAITIPYEENPLFKSNLKFFLIFFSFMISIFIFKQTNQIFFILSISFVLTTLFITLHFTNYTKKYERVFFHILTLYTCICWMNLITSILLEIIYYYSFLLEINETFLSMIIISSGNSMGDLFSVVALSEIGDGLLGFLSVFSSQAYNLYIGLALNMIIGKDYNFDIFKKSSEFTHTLILIKFLIAFSFGIIMIHFLYAIFNKWIYKRSFIFISASFYVLFVFAAFYSLKIELK